MKKFLKLFLIIGCMVFFASSAQAMTFRTDENVLLSNDVQEDVYIFAENTIVNANIDGDLYIAGGKVQVHGKVTGDLMIAGGEVNMDGEVTGDARITGGNIFINGSIGEDLLIAGGEIKINQNTNIGGDLISGSGSLTMQGMVNGDMIVKSGEVSIFDGKINGNVKVRVQNDLMITQNSLIQGNFDYSAPREIQIPSGVVMGKISFDKMDSRKFAEEITEVFIGWQLYSFLAALLVLVMFVIFTPNIVVKSAEVSKNHFFKFLGIGFLVLVSAFVISILLMITIIGIPLGLMALIATFIIAYLSKIFVASMIAGRFFKFKKTTSKLKLFFQTGLVLLLYYGICTIPVVGWIVAAILFFVGIGIWFQIEMDCYKILRSKKEI